MDIFNTNIIVIVAVMKTSSGSKSRYNKSNMYSNSNNVIMTVLAETIETMVLVIWIIIAVVKTINSSCN